MAAPDNQAARKDFSFSECRATTWVDMQGRPPVAENRHELFSRERKPHIAIPREEMMTTINDGLQTTYVLYVPGTVISLLKILPRLISLATKWC